MPFNLDGLISILIRLCHVATLQKYYHHQHISFSWFTVPLRPLQIHRVNGGGNARHNAVEGTANLIGLDEGARNQSGAAVGGGLNAIRNALRSRRYQI